MFDLFSLSCARSTLLRWLARWREIGHFWPPLQDRGVNTMKNCGTLHAAIDALQSLNSRACKQVLTLEGNNGANTGCTTAPLLWTPLWAPKQGHYGCHYVVPNGVLQTTPSCCDTSWTPLWTPEGPYMGRTMATNVCGACTHRHPLENLMRTKDQNLA